MAEHPNSRIAKYTLKLRTTKTAIVLPTPIQRRFSYSDSPEISAARSVRTGRICPPSILLYRLSNIHCPLSHAQLQLPLPCDINFTTSSSSSIHCISLSGAIVKSRFLSLLPLWRQCKLDNQIASSANPFRNQSNSS